MEEQKKTQGEAGGDSLFDGGFDTAVPERPWATLKRLWHTAQDQHLRLLVVVLSVVCYTALAIAAPYYSAGIVDLLWENIQRAQGLGEAFVVTWRQGGREIFVLLLLYLGSWGFYTLQSYLMVGFAEQLNLRLRREMSEKLHRLPLSYLDSHQTGATLSHFTNDMDKMSEAMQYGILRLVTSVVLIVGSVVMMFRFNVVMTLLFLVFTLLSMVVTKLFSGVTLRRASRRQQALSQVTGLVEEAYSGRVVIKAFCREQASAGEIHRATEELAQATEKADFMMNAINPTVRLVNRLGQMGIAVFAGWQLLSGQLTVGVFQAFFQYVNQSAEPLTEASYVINSMQSALASAERVYRAAGRPGGAARPRPAPAWWTGPGGRWSSATCRFGYTPDRPLMKDISFAARPGQKVAIVGATGAGKTTLINLLMRFYEVDGGQILLDGVDTAAMTRDEPAATTSAWSSRTPGSLTAPSRRTSPTASPTPPGRRSWRRPGPPGWTSSSAPCPRGTTRCWATRRSNLSAGQRQLLTIARVVLSRPAHAHPGRGHLQRGYPHGDGDRQGHAGPDARAGPALSSPTGCPPSWTRT